MNYFEDYTSDNEEINSNENNNNKEEQEEQEEDKNNIFKTPKITLKPQLLIPTTTTSIISNITTIIPYKNNNNNNNNNNQQLLTNPSINVVLAPYEGPSHPYRFNENIKGSKQVGMGQIEDALMDDSIFDDQYQTYVRSGFAIDPNTNQILGDVNSYYTVNNETTKQTRERVNAVKNKRKREEYIDLGDGDSPWAIVPEEKEEEIVQPTSNNNSEDNNNDNSNNNNKQDTLESLPIPIPASVVSRAKASKKRTTNKGGEGEEEDEQEGQQEKEEDIRKTEQHEQIIPPNVHIIEPDEEAEKWERVNERKMSYTLPPRPARGSVIGEAKSTFHGSEERDYQGRSWIVPPSGIRPDDGDHECFIPKKCVKKYTGHTKGVQAIEFFPGTGHLLLSASLDGKCKIWDVYGDRNVKRTYSGHDESIRSIHMANDGLSFLSSAYDRYIRLWDTETGQAKATFCNRKMGYQVKFHPRDNNVFLMAASDNKIYQWDARSGSIVQEYNYHLQPCNTVTFFDDGRRFVSTSDDKKILVWEFDIPVPIKYIQEPDMHSIPSVTLAPNGDFFAGQSMDNSIVVYQCGEKVKKLGRKVFRGHTNIGYACQIGFSPNSKFIISGDSTGKLHVWDWKTVKPYRKLQAHDGGPCMGALWHPLQPSLIATCGWDGLIKLWD